MNRTAHFWPFRQLPSDVQGNRVLKEETGAGGVVSKRTWYVRDAAGQHLTTYEQSGGSGTPRAKEYLLYGSSRLGTAYADNANGGAPVSGALYHRVVGQKQYELADHLGNVRATVGDIKVRSGSTFAARVESHTEYFPFGMVASTATVAGGVGGRFGFNGQERVDELKGLGNHNTAEFWEYDTRAVQRFNMDPRPNMEMSPYAVFAGNPVMYSDAKGDTITINLFDPNKDKVMYEYADNAVQDQINDGVFLIFGHSDNRSLKQPNQKDINPRDFIQRISLISPEFAESVSFQQPVVIKLYACNAAAQMYYDDQGGERKVTMTFAEQVSHKLPKDSEVIAPNGYAFFGRGNDAKPLFLGIGERKTPNTWSNQGGFVHFVNGKIESFEINWYNPVTKKSGN